MITYRYKCVHGRGRQKQIAARIAVARKRRHDDG
jgi:hypothetical protein